MPLEFHFNIRWNTRYNFSQIESKPSKNPRSPPQPKKTQSNALSTSKPIEPFEKLSYINAHFKSVKKKSVKLGETYSRST